MPDGSAKRKRVRVQNVLAVFEWDAISGSGAFVASAMGQVVMDMSKGGVA